MKNRMLFFTGVTLAAALSMNALTRIRASQLALVPPPTGFTSLVVIQPDGTVSQRIMKGFELDNDTISIPVSKRRYITVRLTPAKQTKAPEGLVCLFLNGLLVSSPDDYAIVAGDIVFTSYYRDDDIRSLSALVEVAQ